MPENLERYKRFTFAFWESRVTTAMRVARVMSSGIASGQGTVLAIAGFAGTGKTTLAFCLAKQLHANGCQDIAIIDERHFWAIGRLQVLGLATWAHRNRAVVILVPGMTRLENSAAPTGRSVLYVSSKVWYLSRDPGSITVHVKEAKNRWSTNVSPEMKFNVTDADFMRATVDHAYFENGAAALRQINR